MFYLSWSDEEKQKKKAEIITQLWHCQSLQKLIDGICFRNGIRRSTAIAEDVVGLVFEKINKKSADYVLALFYDDGNKPEGHLKRLIGLGCTIAFREGVSKADNPKHSLAQHILYSSNFNQLASLSPTEEESGDSNHDALILEDEADETPYDQMWEIIKDHLEDHELEWLHHFIHEKKKQGRYKDEVLKKRLHLLQRIQDIITKHKIIIPSKKVAKLNRIGRVHKVFPSVQHASKQTGINPIEITASCNDKTQTKKAGGFIWQYINEKK